MIKIASKNISKLDLSNMDLIKFPKEILELKNLRKLNLSGNKIAVIPSEIEKLKNLELLDLSNNEISNFYAKICSLTKLKILNLNNNKIKTIPKQISNLKKLRILLLSNNRIISFPKSIIELVSIQKLNISKNLIVDFPNEILKLSSLKVLWLNYLQLKSFPISQISNELNNLTGIYCYGKIVNTNNINKNYIHLSKIKGNCLADFILLASSIKINSEKPKTSLNKETSKLKVQKNKIFISYSHQDKDWLQKVQTNLKVLKFNDYDFYLWDDTRIKSGDKWKKEIENALEISGIAILIISTDFLASDFIRSNELPTILKNAEENGTKILPLIVRPCRFTKDKNLSIFQSVNDPNKPLSSLKDYDIEKELVNLTEDVSKILID